MLIITLVIFDVIATSELSINCSTLLYLNLPPNLFTSTDLEYASITLNTVDFKFSMLVTWEEL